MENHTDATVLAAVAQDGWALREAGPALQADKEVVLAAVAQHGWALNWASPELRADKDVVLAAAAAIQLETSPQSATGPACVLQ